jgi:hypothetical protein
MKPTRRQFLKSAILIALANRTSGVAWADNAQPSSATASAPWFRRTLRWGQTNITEDDPASYDIEWWRAYWRRTRIQGVIINAGGIVAYYPSESPLHYRANNLGDRDLLGELIHAAHAEGFVALARMDSNRAHAEFYRQHPDWFARDAAGKPYRAGELYISCINSPYYREYLPGILREIAARYHPEGFTDNSWSGLGRGSICYCDHCRSQFQEYSGADLPRATNWDDPIYRRWVMWNYQRRLEVWNLNNQTTGTAGGPHCIWAGMMSGSISGQCQSFRDNASLCACAELVMLDHQARNDAAGFHQNAEIGQLIHGLLGWDKLIPESMAMYQAGKPAFRKSAKPVLEARLWMLEGIAGGIQPWWHHVGALQEDRRQFEIAPPVDQWHASNQEFLVNRAPLANVGLVWSQRHTDFYGRDRADVLVEEPWRGWANAMVRARIPYLPVHVDHIDRDAPNLQALILPNLAALSDAQAKAVQRFVERGGRLIATGRTSLFDEWGQARADFALAKLFGAHWVGEIQPSPDADFKRATDTQHTYLRLLPEISTNRTGSTLPLDSTPSPNRHQILLGFEATNILAFGGWLGDVTAEENSEVLCTFVPSFPVYPPETSWMRQPRSNLPGLIVRQFAQGAAAFMPADLDRRYAADNLPDHGQILANLVRWAVNNQFPVKVTGPGLIDCQLYRQSNRLILHLVNLTNTGAWRAPADEVIPVGPLHVQLQLPQGINGRRARLLVAGHKISPHRHGTFCQLAVPTLNEHEVIVLD